MDRTAVRRSLHRMVRSHLWLAGDNDPLRDVLRRRMLVNVPHAVSANDILDEDLAARLLILARLNSDAIPSDRIQSDERVTEMWWSRNEAPYLANVCG